MSHTLVVWSAEVVARRRQSGEMMQRMTYEACACSFWSGSIRSRDGTAPPTSAWRGSAPSAADGALASLASLASAGSVGSAGSADEPHCSRSAEARLSPQPGAGPSLHKKTEPRTFAAARVEASRAIESDWMDLSPSGTSSAEHAFCARSHTRMLPSRSPDTISTWLGWRATELIGEPDSYSRWQPAARRSHSLSVPSSDAVYIHLPSASKPTAVTLEVWPS
mmetsp:Transcript_27740/g.90472  ORF Transcript_27740/g.90472 Transcript_27740/m.90472 type:complete len:222 (-) Transcript_27740:266-931(-)